MKNKLVYFCCLIMSILLIGCGGDDTGGGGSNNPNPVTSNDEIIAFPQAYFPREAAYYYNGKIPVLVNITKVTTFQDTSYELVGYELPTNAQAVNFINQEFSKDINVSYNVEESSCRQLTDTNEINFLRPYPAIRVDTNTTPIKYDETKNNEVVDTEAIKSFKYILCLVDIDAGSTDYLGLTANGIFTVPSDGSTITINRVNIQRVTNDQVELRKGTFTTSNGDTILSFTPSFDVSNDRFNQFFIDNVNSDNSNISLLNVKSFVGYNTKIKPEGDGVNFPPDTNLVRVFCEGNDLPIPNSDLDKNDLTITLSNYECMKPLFSPSGNTCNVSSYCAPFLPE